MSASYCPQTDGGIENMLRELERDGLQSFMENTRGPHSVSHVAGSHGAGGTRPSSIASGVTIDGAPSASLLRPICAPWGGQQNLGPQQTLGPQTLGPPRARMPCAADARSVSEAGEASEESELYLATQLAHPTALQMLTGFGARSGSSWRAASAQGTVGQESGGSIATEMTTFPQRPRSQGRSSRIRGWLGGMKSRRAHDDENPSPGLPAQASSSRCAPLLTPGAASSSSMEEQPMLARPRAAAATAAAACAAADAAAVSAPIVVTPLAHALTMPQHTRVARPPGPYGPPSSYGTMSELESATRDLLGSTTSGSVPPSSSGSFHGGGAGAHAATRGAPPPHPCLTPISSSVSPPSSTTTERPTSSSTGRPDSTPITLSHASSC